MRERFIVMGAASLLCGCQGVESGSAAFGGGMLGGDGGDACPAGTLDTTFGEAGTGIVRTSLMPDDAGGFFALDVEGTAIAAAGWGVGGLGGSSFKVARLREDGTPVRAFGDDGLVETYWGPTTHHYGFAHGVGHQRGGEIVAIGYLDTIVEQDVALARYDGSGALDPTFGLDGRVLVDLGGAELVEDGLVTADDAIVAVGSREEELLVARFSPDGALDASFADGTGYRTLAPGALSWAAAVALDDAGRIVVAGGVAHDGQRDVLLVRLTRDGALDPSFGDGGVVIARDPLVDEQAAAVAVADDGAIVIAGDSGDTGRDFLVRRFLEDGRPDLGFGEEGAVITPVTPGEDRVADAALVRGGGVLVVGNVRVGSLNTSIIALYTPRGELDLSFGKGGVLSVDVGKYGALHAVAIDADGRALLGGGDEGASPGPGTYAVVARLCL